MITQTPTVQFIRMSDLNLFEVDGTSICKWLELLKLDVSNNTITKLRDKDWKECNQLRWLNLFKNEIAQLTSMVFDGLTALEILDLSTNRINFFAENVFRPLKRLKSLRLDTNHIQIIDADLFNHNHNLRTLYLNDNSIEIIQPRAFWRLNKLTTLDIGNNQNLSFIDLSNMASLSDVIVSNAALKSLVIPMDVRRIDARNNQITHVNASIDSRIETLNVENNHIITVRDIQPMNNLIELNLELNSIVGLNIQNSNQFVRIINEFNEKMPNLQLVQISDNSFYTSDQFESATNELKKQNISIVIKLVGNIRSLHILFHPVNQSRHDANSIDLNADQSSEIVSDVFERLKRVEFAVQHIDQGKIDEKFASLTILIALMVVMTVGNLACIVFCNYEYILRSIRRMRNRQRNVSTENLNVEVEL